MRRPRIGPVGEVLLNSVAIAGVVTIAVCAPNALQVLKPFFKKKKYSPKQAIARSIESLVASGLVRYTNDVEGNPSIELTKKGRWEASIRNKTLPTRRGKKWDGMWRVVIFDVPNVHVKLRDQLRRGMRLYGFHLLQKSVWVYPYRCDDFVALVREHLGLSSNVLYMTVNTIENTSELRKTFKL